MFKWCLGLLWTFHNNQVLLYGGYKIFKIISGLSKQYRSQWTTWVVHSASRVNRETRTKTQTVAYSGRVPPQHHVHSRLIPNGSHKTEFLRSQTDRVDFLRLRLHKLTIMCANKFTRVFVSLQLLGNCVVSIGYLTHASVEIATKCCIRCVQVITDGAFTLRRCNSESKSQYQVSVYSPLLSVTRIVFWLHGDIVSHLASRRSSRHPVWQQKRPVNVTGSKWCAEWFIYSCWHITCCAPIGSICSCYWFRHRSSSVVSAGPLSSGLNQCTSRLNPVRPTWCCAAAQQTIKHRLLLTIIHVTRFTGGRSRLALYSHFAVKKTTEDSRENKCDIISLCKVINDNTVVRISARRVFKH